MRAIKNEKEVTMSNGLRDTKNDLGANVRQEMVAMLNTALACAIDLSAQTKQAHWNVRGPNFAQLHPFFDGLYTIAVGMVDELAERITALGGLAEGRVQTIASNTKLPTLMATTDEKDHLQGLVNSFSTFAAFTRHGIDTAAEKGDQVTADLLTGQTRELDKQLWMLEAHFTK